MVVRNVLTANGRGDDRNGRRMGRNSRRHDAIRLSSHGRGDRRRSRHNNRSRKPPGSRRNRCIRSAAPPKPAGPGSRRPGGRLRAGGYAVEHDGLRGVGVSSSSTSTNIGRSFPIPWPGWFHSEIFCFTMSCRDGFEQLTGLGAMTDDGTTGGTPQRYPGEGLPALVRRASALSAPGPRRGASERACGLARGGDRAAPARAM